MQLLTNIQDIDRSKWEHLLKVSQYTSPFQTPGFYDLYNELEGQKADVFVVEEEERFLALVVITIQHEKGLKSYFSRRGIIYGGLLLHPEATQHHIKLLAAHLEEAYHHQLIYLEIRNNFNYSAFKNVLQQTGFDYVPWLNIQFENISAESFRNGWTKTRQRQLNKALKNGVSWRPATSMDDVRAFYVILSRLYKYKVKKPLPSLDFFEKLYESPFARCLVVENESGIIGGVMCPFYPEKSLYEFYICGLDRDCPSHHPSIVAMWAMVEYAEQNNIPNLDLMGAGQVGKSSSIREFKSKFGGKMVENGRFVMVFNRFLYRLGVFYLSLLSRF